MQRDDALRLLRGGLAQLQRLGVGQLYLYGSVARNVAREDSDVDTARRTSISATWLHTVLCIDRRNGKATAVGMQLAVHRRSLPAHATR
jgi:predicted nucleotidyltransferase